MSKQATAILEIMAEVERIDAAPHTKYSLKKFISERCRAAGITIVDRKDRIQFARRLLDDGESRPVIRERLMVRFGIKRASAYNAIDAALRLSNGRVRIWTNDAQTSITGSTNPLNTKDDDDEPLPQ